MDTDIMTMKEVADYLKINDKTAYKLTAEGKIPGFKVGGAWRFKKVKLIAGSQNRAAKRSEGNASADQIKRTSQRSRRSIHF